MAGGYYAANGIAGRAAGLKPLLQLSSTASVDCRVVDCFLWVGGGDVPYAQVTLPYAALAGTPGGSGKSNGGGFRPATEPRFGQGIRDDLCRSRLIPIPIVVDGNHDTSHLLNTRARVTLIHLWTAVGC